MTPARQVPAVPKAKPEYEHVSVRLSEEIIARIDALRLGLSTEWLKAKRSDALRKVILSGLDALERQRAAQQRGRAPRRRQARRPKG